MARRETAGLARKRKHAPRRACSPPPRPGSRGHLQPAGVVLTTECRWSSAGVRPLPNSGKEACLLPFPPGEACLSALRAQAGVRRALLAAGGDARLRVRRASMVKTRRAESQMRRPGSLIKPRVTRFLEVLGGRVPRVTRIPELPRVTRIPESSIYIQIMM